MTMTIMTAQRAIKLLLAASALALLSGCFAVVGATHRPHPHSSYHDHFWDDAPRWGHVPHGRHHQRHFGGHGGHRSPPFHHRRHRR